MVGGIQLFTEPDELLNWLDENDLLMELDTKEAEVLLLYMEGHDYGLGASEGKLIRVDVGEENGEVTEVVRS